MEWRDIESAPKDGRVVWGAESIGGFGITIYYAMKFKNDHWVVDWNHEECDPQQWQQITPPA